MKKGITIFIAIVLYFNCFSNNDLCVTAFLDSVNPKITAIHDGRYHVVFKFSGQLPPVKSSFEGTAYFSHDSATIGSVGDFVMFEKDTVPSFAYLSEYFYRFDAVSKTYTKQYLKRSNFFQKSSFDLRHFMAVYYMLVNLQYPLESYLEEKGDSAFCHTTVVGYMKRDTLHSIQQGDQLRKSYRYLRRSKASDTIEIHNVDMFGGDLRKREWIIDGMLPVDGCEKYLQEKVNQFTKAYKSIDTTDFDDKNEVQPAVVIDKRKLFLDTVPSNTVLKTMEYKPYSMDNAGGKLLLLDFWFANCRPCIEAMPKLEQLNKAFHDKGLSIIGINPYDYDMDILKGLLTKAGVTYDICLDSEAEMVKAMGMFSFPEMLLVDPKSKKIISEYTAGSDLSKLQKEIERILK